MSIKSDALVKDMDQGIGMFSRWHIINKLGYTEEDIQEAAREGKILIANPGISSSILLVYQT
jgi:hypothetical protein